MSAVAISPARVAEQLTVEQMLAGLHALTKTDTAPDDWATGFGWVQLTLFDLPAAGPDHNERAAS